MEPIRVLQIVSSMIVGGTENFLMTNYRYVDKNRVQFDFLKHRDSHDYYDDEILGMGGRIYSVPPINPIRQVQYDAAVSHFFKEHKGTYPIIHSHLNSLSAYSLRIAKREGIPVRIAHAHAKPNTINYKTPIIMYTKHIIKNYYTDAFACSNEAGKWLFGNSPFTIIPNAIDSNMYLPQEQIRRDIREELGISDGFVIGMVANFKTVKNHGFIVNVFSKILKKVPDAYLVLVGYGEVKANIEKLVADMNLSNRVIFTGLREDVNRVLQGLDVFVLPSVSEGFAISVLEAETVGIPCVVSTGVPTDVKLFDEMNTSFISTANEDDWIEKIISLQKATKRNWVKEISKTQYDVRNNAEKLMEFYEDKYRKCQK